MPTMANVIQYAPVSSPDLIRYGFSDDGFVNILVVEDSSDGECIHTTTVSCSYGGST